MDIIRDFDSEVNYVLDKCKSIVASYPSSMRETAFGYLKKLQLLKEETQRNGGFAYLMPFWLMQPFKLSTEVCHTIALGNVFALLYFISQDDIMDSREYKGDILPLSNIFFLDFITQYRTLFPSESNFWEHFNKYINEWAESVLWERRMHGCIANPYTEDDMILLSRKAAPLKIPFAAICILSGQGNLIEKFSRMVDYDQVVYQMIDDWIDWRKDIENKNYTYFLMQVMEYCKNSPQLDEVQVKKAIYIGDVAEKVFGLAKRYSKLTMESISDIDIPYLKVYIKLEESYCDDILNKVQNERQRAMGGGLKSLLDRL